MGQPAWPTRRAHVLIAARRCWPVSRGVEPVLRGRSLRHQQDKRAVRRIDHDLVTVLQQRERTADRGLGFDLAR